MRRPPSAGNGRPKADGNYAVGYGKPPLHTRFQAGQTGNPRGRPKGVRNFSTDVRQTSVMPVILVEGGRRRKTSTQQGILLKLREKALKGDQRAIEKLVELIARYNDAPAPAMSAEATQAEDQAILANYEARLLERLQANVAQPPSPAATTKHAASKPRQRRSVAGRLHEEAKDPKGKRK